jgi:hypothetical protein
VAPQTGPPRPFPSWKIPADEKDVQGFPLLMKEGMRLEFRKIVKQQPRLQADLVQTLRRRNNNRFEQTSVTWVSSEIDRGDVDRSIKLPTFVADLCAAPDGVKALGAPFCERLPGKTAEFFNEICQGHGLPGGVALAGASPAGDPAPAPATVTLIPTLPQVQMVFCMNSYCYISSSSCRCLASRR